MGPILYLLCLNVLIAILSNVKGLRARQLWSKAVGEFDDKIISAFSRSRTHGTALDCQNLCLRDEECMSYFHDPVTGACQTHEVVFFNSDDSQWSPGTRYYRHFQDFCPSRLGYILNRALNFCYKIHYLTMGNHSYASHVCSSEGGRLVTADTLGKLYHLVRAIKASNLTISTEFDFLVGVTYNVTEGLWRWTDGQILDSGYWCPNQPNNFIGNAFYAMLQNKSPDLPGCLNDIPASHIRHFVCEIFI